MADEKKSQQVKSKKVAAKKAVKKKAAPKKRVAPKKAGVKKAVPKKTVAKKRAVKQTTPKEIPSSEASVVLSLQAGAAAPEQAPEIPASAPESKKSTAQHAVPQTRTTTRHVWWRVAVIVIVVAGIFAYIRHVAHTGDDIARKTMAPSPWATPEPETNTAQPHPWELAPEPQTEDSDSKQPYYTQQGQQEYPRLEPWQPPQTATGQPSQPYYPPPPGYYGHPQSADNAAPYQR